MAIQSRLSQIQARIDQFLYVFELAFQKTLGRNPHRQTNHNTEDEAIDRPLPSSSSQDVNSQNEVLQYDEDALSDDEATRDWASPPKKKRYFGYLRTKRFYLAFFIGQVISLCLTCTNTLTSEMAGHGTSMPLFQNLLNYALLAIVHNPIMWYKYGFKKWFKILVYDSWRFFILAFIDVQGNFFVTLAYDYTNILSAALLDNFSIVVVVILSYVFLHVRYHWSQYIGILVTIGGMALLCVSDRLTGKDYAASDKVKGDLFVLLGAACYGFSNTFEEFLVSERPIYEVLGNLGFWATCINGVQLAIFERSNVRDAKWSGEVGGYLTGYALTMFLLYHLAPFMFRLASAAFYNLNTLTSDFWSLLVGIEAFGYYVYWLYPVGFVFTVIGIVCYCSAPMTDLGESVKPWLGPDQENGVNGFLTARHTKKRRQERDAANNDSSSSTSSKDPVEISVREEDSRSTKSRKSFVSVENSRFGESLASELQGDEAQAGMSHTRAGPPSSA